MNLHPASQEQNFALLERLLMEAERMLPEPDRDTLVALISSGTPEEVYEFIRGKLPVADLVARVRAA